MKLYNTLLLTLYTLLSFSQFNIIVEDSTRNHLFTQVIQQNNNYRIISGTTDNYGNRGISIIKTDTTGTIIEQKIISKNNEIWSEGLSQSYNEQSKFLAGSKVTDNTRGLIVLFDNNFDTIFTKIQYKDTFASAYYGNVSVYNNKIICAGQIETENEYANGFLVKYNINGDTIWTKSIGNSSDDLLGKKTIETFDSSLISIGYTYIGSAIYKQDWYIVKTDSLGNLDWWLHPGNPNLNDGMAQDIIQTKDSCFVVVGGKAIYRNAGGTKFDGRIMKFDINGNILWDKTYRNKLTQPGYDSLYCYFKSIIELDDGGFAVATSIKNNVQYIPYISSLYRFNSEGDTIWTRKYCSRCSYLGDNTISAGIAFASTIQKTDNNNFLIGGWGNFEMLFNHAYYQQMFLIKTDNLGCDGTEYSCPLVSVPRLITEKKEGILVYPNPATNNLILDLQGLQNYRNVIIYDIYGRYVRKETIDKRNSKIEINIVDLQSGIYFIKIGEYSTKFVKE